MSVLLEEIDSVLEESLSDHRLIQEKEIRYIVEKLGPLFEEKAELDASTVKTLLRVTGLRKDQVLKKLGEYIEDQESGPLRGTKGTIDLVDDAKRLGYLLGNVWDDIETSGTKNLDKFYEIPEPQAEEPEEEKEDEDKPQEKPAPRGGAYKFMDQTRSFGLPSKSPRANTLQEDKLVEIVVDFAELRKQKLDESFLAMFGGWVEHILGAMFGDLNIPVSVRGNDREVQAFATAIGREKNYIDVARRYGLDHPSTYKSKAKLTSAAKNFERETGLKWPFK